MSALQTLVSAEAYLDLASRAGFDLDRRGLDELGRLGIIEPVVSDQVVSDQVVSDQSDRPGFHELHLFVLAQYFGAVRPTEHPWGRSDPELSLAEVETGAAEMHNFIGTLVDPRQAPPSADIARTVANLRQSCRAGNPFGPLTDVVDLLQADAVGRLRGAGLRYAIFSRLADSLEAIDAQSVGASRQHDPAEAKLRDTVQEVSVPPETADPADQDTGRQPHGSQPQDTANEFARDSAQPTSRTENLRARLDRLQNQDKAVAEGRGQPSSASTADPDDAPCAQSAGGDASAGDVQAASAPADPSEPSGAPDQSASPDNLGQRIAALNRMRETYLAEQRWDELADLYEDGLELFTDPAERRQVLMTLAMINEVKLGRLDAAFAKFRAAYHIDGGADERKKAVAGLARLGRRPALVGPWVEFLEAHLSEESLDARTRAEFQRHLALALNTAGEGRRACLTYAAFGADAPPEAISDRVLDDLEQLAEADGVDDEWLGDVFVDLLDRPLSDDLFESLAIRGARHHADCGQVGMAMDCYERLLSRLPGHEVAFHSLAQLYEDSQRLARLEALYEAKLELEGNDASDGLVSEHVRIQQMAHFD